MLRVWDNDKEHVVRSGQIYWFRTTKQSFQITVITWRVIERALTVWLVYWSMNQKVTYAKWSWNARPALVHHRGRDHPWEDLENAPFTTTVRNNCMGRWGVSASLKCSVLAPLRRSEIKVGIAATKVESLKCNGGIWIPWGRGHQVAHLIAKGKVGMVSMMKSESKQ